MQRPHDLLGLRVGAPLNDIGFRLFRAFAALTDIDPAWVNLQLPRRACTRCFW